jgi:hypothetical protein
MCRWHIFYGGGNKWLFKLSRWKIWELYWRNQPCVYRALRSGVLLPRRLYGAVWWYSHYGGRFYNSVSRRDIFYRWSDFCGKLYRLPCGNIQ